MAGGERAPSSVLHQRAAPTRLAVLLTLHCRFLNVLGLAWTVFMSCLANDSLPVKPDAAVERPFSPQRRPA
jgi:hypothetical protein